MSQADKSTNEPQPRFEASGPPARSQDDRRPQFQIGLVGFEKVGKTALVRRFLYGEKSMEYVPTGYDVYNAKMYYDRQEMTVRIGDAGGHVSNRNLMAKNIAESNGFLIVYDITRQESFDALKGIHDDLTGLKGQCVRQPFVIVGAKKDLNTFRDVLVSEGTKLARVMHCQFFETSIITGENVSEAFNSLLGEIVGKETRPRAEQESAQGCCVLL